MSLSVVFTPEAEDQLVELYRYIVAVKSAEVAARYTDAIIDFCQELAFVLDFTFQPQLDAA
ncbi:hypothetical protein A5634_06090 [Mycobacterium asiaticum]|uniref:Plasmid stabilization protein n=1 Tax=Mycobacterium asiaticum TaxID=1790 RepID=A0A1A3NPU3_MYCAS|nr:type II toxin-antitoxin system RelE/ParE family toxin [Mycobacterium asiaticum]OBK23084.1 hypothetical protein A5634_06090 [Mycobacterium asiaticum]